MLNQGKSLETDRKSGIYVPSFAFEKKTKAFNKYIWWFVSLISMFSVGVGVVVYHTFMCYFLSLVSTFILDNLLWIMLIPMLACVVLCYQLVQFLLALMSSYKMESGRIIKGTIRGRNVRRADLAADAVLVTNMVRHPDDSSEVFKTHTILRLNNIIEMIRLNMNPGYARAYFDTEMYKKKIYENPILTKETRFSMVYTCSNKRKLIIPKIYDGICDTEGKATLSYIARILIRAAVVFVIAFLVATADLAVGYSRNHEYVSAISDAKDEIAQELTCYGYTVYKPNEKMYRFTKEVGDGDRTSTVSYFFEKNGNVKNVDIQLYYDNHSEDIASELAYIISTIPADFDNREVDDFIDLVEENMEGTYKYGKLEAGKFTLTLGKSDHYVDIHSY